MINLIDDLATKTAALHGIPLLTKFLSLNSLLTLLGHLKCHHDIIDTLAVNTKTISYGTYLDESQRLLK
ncbi:hypothetical protein GCM10011403_28760 [Pseudohongiella nitratireducens]|uniref:Uncharacterized protein n=1 Tax=Pseudohongiella nitratireducens TaxID=1768907 RepID=A0A916QP58_9GAMM|nr:hypothetical protein GCM10011403_28760 [Pseudohongiella nitratireducens]